MHRKMPGKTYSKLSKMGSSGKESETWREKRGRLECFFFCISTLFGILSCEYSNVNFFKKKHVQ